MKDLNKAAARTGSSRREFLRNSGRVAAAGALAGAIVPQVHAAQDDTVQVALIGAGGRGTGAAANALSVNNGPIKLVAVADVFQNRLDGSVQNLKGQFGDKVDAPKERQFIGFDAYKRAMDCLKPGDIALLGTPPAFRWPHLAYAIEKGINVFMEKPITVDGPSTRRMLKLGEEAEKKNLKVAVGLMCRHCVRRQELYKRIQDGEIGDIISMRAYRMHGPIASFDSDPRPQDQDELLWQISRFHSFLWASGGAFSDFYIHNIDECCWMKDAWPVVAQGSGGRHYRSTRVDQNFDNYSIEYTFDDGAKFHYYGRCISGCKDQFGAYVHGSKGLAVICDTGHTPAHCRIYKSQKPTRENLVWAAEQPEPNPYQLEWDNLVRSIREGLPHNEVRRGAEASLVTALGRMAAHTGQEITYDEALNWEHEFAPDVDKLVDGATAPVVANAEGKYPVPMPGIVRNREYPA